jgi:hypothetical protein
MHLGQVVGSSSTKSLSKYYANKKKILWKSKENKEARNEK